MEELFRLDGALPHHFDRALLVGGRTGDRDMWYETWRYERS